MANSNFLKRLMDAGVTFGEVTQTKADEISKMLKDNGVKRKDAEATVAALAEQARTHTDRFVSRIKAEMADQIVLLADRIDELEDRLEQLADKASARLRNEPKSATPAAQTAADTSGLADRPVAKKPAPKKSVAKKAVAKKATVTKAVPQKAAVSKTAAKKAPAKKAGTKKAGK